MSPAISQPRCSRFGGGSVKFEKPWAAVAVDPRANTRPALLAPPSEKTNEARGHDGISSGLRGHRGIRRWTAWDITHTLARIRDP